MLWRFAVALVVSTLIVGACAQQPNTGNPVLTPVQQSLTAPTSAVAPTTSEPRTATSQATSNFALDVYAATCPLMPAGITEIHGGGKLTFVIRNTTDGNGGSHVGLTIHGNGTATDNLGGKWTWSDADLNNSVLGLPTGNDSVNTYELTVKEGFHLIGPKGQKIIVKGTAHVTVVQGTVTKVDFEKGNETAANEPCEGFTQL